jgi:hypothetical protein
VREHGVVAQQGLRSNAAAIVFETSSGVTPLEWRLVGLRSIPRRGGPSGTV